MINLDYDILRDDGCEYYESADRTAFYEWLGPGDTYIELMDRRTGERATGYIQQSEKADGICRAWIEEGRYKTDSFGCPTYWWRDY